MLRTRIDIGALVARLRYVVVVFWVAAAAAATLLLPSIEESQTNSLGDLVATDAEAIQTEIRAFELFEFPLLSRTVVVQRDPGRISPAAMARVVENAARLTGQLVPGLESIRFALPVTNALGEPPFSRESSTTALTYLFFPPEIGPTGRTGLASLFAERMLERPEDAYVGVTGAVPARAEQQQLIGDGLRWVELATILLVCLAIALHFRAVGPPFLNLAAIAVSYLVAARVLAALGELVGITVPAEVEPVLVALVFGVVTDYSIFFVSRFRGGLAAGEGEVEAARRTTNELLPIILVAGLTVAAATATLALARLGFFQAFGPGLAVSVLVALAVSTTLVPALMAIFGRRLFWPARPGTQAKGPSRGGRARAWLRRARENILAAPGKRPALVAVLTALPLLALAAGLTGLEVGNRTITSLPRDSPPRQAYQQAIKGFAPGILSPTVVVVEGDGVTTQRAGLVRLQGLIRSRRGIAEVVGPSQSALPFRFGAVFSQTGGAARYFVVLERAPYGARAIETVEELSEDLPALLDQARLSGASAALAGDTAISAETVSKSSSDLVRVMPAATLVVFLILAAFLRALVAPLYLVASSLLALAAALGLTVLVFQDLLGYGELAFYVPFAATVLLVALGSDYNVYLVGRVWSEARRRPLREALEIAGARATGAITAAGMVLAASFAALALIPLRSFRELAFAVSVGLLIDAFIVRALLTPALISLVGERSGWPGGRLRRWKPKRAAAGSDPGPAEQR